MRYRTPEQKKVLRERVMKYRAEHQEEYRASKKKWQAEHREEINERNRKNRAENPEKHRERVRKYIAENPDKHREHTRMYKSRDVNSTGVTKSYIRVLSRQIRSKAHAKLIGYEIHHCFGYEDPNRFIYISKTLHQKIHQLLRENKISADSNHWNVIRDLVNNCEEYTYIRT